MLKNYLKVAWRVILRQRVFSAINIAGLAIGIAACLLITQYIAFELSYDNFQKNGDHIYRIRHRQYTSGNLVEDLPKTFSAVGPSLKKEFPEVIATTRIEPFDGLVTAERKDGSTEAFNEHGIYRVDPAFLSMFTFPMVAGSIDALKGPNSVVITEATAEKYFPGQDPIGKPIRIQRESESIDITGTITGVCKDVPANSQLQFNFLLSLDPTYLDWVYADYYTYIQLSPQTDAKTFESKLPAFIGRNATLSNNGAKASATQGQTNLANVLLTLQPLRSIHLYSNLSQEISNGGNGTLVWSLGIVALLILTIAYVNYINLSVAKIIERAREVGIRKVLGSLRRQLVAQFLFESLLLNFISFLLAIGIVFLSLPAFRKLCGVDLSFDIFNHALIAIGLFVILLLGIIASALYPALMLSNYKPILILKGKFLNTIRGIALRKTLVVFQFVVTITCMIGAMVIYQQVRYMKNANKSLAMDQTLVVVAPQNVRSTDAESQAFATKDSAFQTELLRDPHIKNVSAGNNIPGQHIGFIMAYENPLQTNGHAPLKIPTLQIGYSLIDQFNLKVVAGRQFSPLLPTDGVAVMLNESAVYALGFKNPQDAIGKYVDNRNGRGRLIQNKIIGVIQNFHQTSLKDAYSPTIFRLVDPTGAGYYMVRLASMGNLPDMIDQIKRTYTSFFPNTAFEYFFLDEFFDRQYKAEQSFGQVFGLFTVLAIITASLGLFGLSLITIARRIKEIGIRKVLGASLLNILFLISRDFLWLIIVSFIIASPLAYWGGYKWLENYQFRIHFNLWFFVIPLFLILMITLMTLTIQSLRAALTNPTKTLRTE